MQGIVSIDTMQLSVKYPKLGHGMMKSEESCRKVVIGLLPCHRIRVRLMPIFKKGGSIVRPGQQKI